MFINASKGLMVKYILFIDRHISFIQASKKAQPLLSSTLKQFQEELKKRQYFGDYFARSANDQLRLCCEKGWFSYEGPYNEKTCSHLHTINPYGSKESRVLFSTWNLDHV